MLGSYQCRQRTLLLTRLSIAWYTSFSDMPEPTKITDHTAQAKARLIYQYQEKERLAAVLEALVDQVQDAEDAAWDLRASLFLDAATKDRLNILGAMVGEPRRNRSDTDYILAIRTRILINRSNGNPDDLIEIFRAGAADLDRDISYYESTPMSARLWDQEAQDWLDQLVDSLQEARTAGASLHVWTNDAGEADTLMFVSGTPTVNAAKGLGSTNDSPITGGDLVRVMT